ncbi:MAG: molybdopterin molybdenumtransferase MoeA, partial [Pseudomonadota bacterium]
MSFETVLMVDWSGGKAGPEKPKKDAIWMCEATAGASQEPAYVRDRVRAEALLAERIELALHEGERLMIGFDFPFGYPAGFAEALTGAADPLALWDDFAERFAPSADGGERWEKAAEMNASLPGDGPFWNCPPSVKLPHLSQFKPTRPAFPEWRAAEEDVAARLKNRASSCWKLFTPGSVGSQALLGISVLARLRQRFAGHVAAWPFEPLTPPIAFVEIWPSLIARDVDAGQRAGEIKDAAQVRILAEAVSRLAPGELSEMLDVDAPEEGWIFGLGHEATLSAAARQGRLRNDCFAMPPGVAWAPVDEALAHLRGALVPITGSEEAPLSDAAGRILAADITAKRAHPPKANAAVDGYAVLGGLGACLHHIPLAPGRAAAGAPFAGSVPEGHALRILTGAQMPMGADTVILEEDCRVTDTQISVEGPLKTGANARKGGEDVEARATILKVGRRLTAPDLALLSATGHGAAPVRQQLRV